MTAIGDVFWRLLLDDSQFDGQVMKAGQRAGTKGGQELNKGLAAELKKLNPKSILGDIATGAGIGGGIAIFNELGRAIRDVAGFIPELIAKGQAYALNVHEISERTGASAEASSNLAATLTFLGIPMDGVGQKLSMMAKQVYVNEKNFAALGIATRGAHKEFLNGVQILDNIRSRYQSLGEGIQRAAIAQQLIGRGGGEFLEYLNLSDRQVAELSVEWAKLGLIMDEAGVQRAKDVQREQALLGLALTGLGERLFQAVAPGILAVTDAFVNLVENKGPEIEAFFGRVAGYVLGLIQALTGLDMSGSDTFLAHLDLAKTAISDTVDVAATQAAATKAATAALTAESAALDVQAAKLTKTAAAEETLFQRKLKNLSATIAAQIASMDADKAAAQAARDLADAQQAISDAQGTLRTDRLTGADTTKDTAALAAANQKIIDLRASQNADARRAQLEATQKYVEDVASLEASSTDKASLAHTMAAREKVLAARIAADKIKGDAQAVALDEIALEAVRTAKARAESGARIATAQSEIAAKKAAIAAEIAALGTIPPVQETINRNYHDGLIAAQQAALGVTGKGGLVEAMNAGKAAGLAMGADLHKVLVGEDGKGGLLKDLQDVAGVVQSIAGSIGDIAKGFGSLPEWAQKAILGAAVGFKTGGLPGAVVGAAAGPAAGNAPGSTLADIFGLNSGVDPGAIQAMIDQIERRVELGEIKLGDIDPAAGQKGFGWPAGETWAAELAFLKGLPSHAAGLWNNPADHLAMIHKSEMVMPAPFATAFREMVPSASFGGADGGSSDSPVIIRVEAGGNELIDYLDRNLHYRRR